VEGEIAEQQLAINLVGILQGDHFKNDFQTGKRIELVGHESRSLNKAGQIESVHIRQPTVIRIKSYHFPRPQEDGLTGDGFDVTTKRAFQHKDFDRSGTPVHARCVFNGNRGSGDGSRHCSCLNRGSPRPFGDLHEHHALAELQITCSFGKRKLRVGTQTGNTLIVEDQLCPRLGTCLQQGLAGQRVTNLGRP
jgi:hypothetical protein